VNRVFGGVVNLALRQRPADMDHQRRGESSDSGESITQRCGQQASKTPGTWKEKRARQRRKWGTGGQERPADTAFVALRFAVVERRHCVCTQRQPRLVMPGG
jgi:hypothetical protein